MGYPHPDHLLREITSAQLAEWYAYGRIEPIGNARGDLQAGIVASTIANVNRRKNTQAFAPQDFMPIQKEQRAVSSDVVSVFKALGDGDSR